jgi:3-oxoacyl-[acyl-carrier protein] reductase
MKLKDKVAIVTGGSGVLGGRICRALAGAGTHVAVGYNTSHDKAKMVAQGLRDAGVQSEAIQCDVTDPAQVEALVSRVLESFGRVDILVNDAAYNHWIPFSDLEAMTFEQWNKMLSTNLTGPMMLMKAVAGAMKRQGAGRIVNISSGAGLYPRGSSIGYAVSKAGLIHLTRCMAVGLAPEVLVNCIAPGYLEGTKMSANLAPDYRESARTASLLKRAADKDDIADQVVAFCRTDSMTGQTLVIDSGLIFH